jgi:hypothetical protein
MRATRREGEKETKRRRDGEQGAQSEEHTCLPAGRERRAGCRACPPSRYSPISTTSGAADGLTGNSLPRGHQRTKKTSGYLCETFVALCLCGECRRRDEVA